MRILITGGTGFLGQHIARKLLAQGHHVHLLGRNFASLSAQSLVAAGAIPIAVDLRDSEAVKAACANIEIVCHAGALSAPWGRRNDFYAINVGGTAAVITGCLAHNVRRLVYISSPSVVFDGRDQQLATELAPYPRRFTSIYSWTKKIGEDLVNTATTQGLQTVILRPKAMFGPGDQSLLPRLVAAARKNRLPQIGDGSNLVDLTYVENVADAIMLAFDSASAIGNTYTVTNDEHIPLWEVIRDVLKRFHLSIHLRRLPLSVALAAAALMEARAAMTGKEPLMTRYTAAILARTQTYDISAAKRDLGYEPCVSAAEGIERTLAAWEDQP